MTFAASLSLPRFMSAEPLARKLAEFRAAMAQRREYLALLDEFERMNDRDWADLGQSRLNAREIARKTVYGF